MFGRTQLNVPRIVFGATSLGNLFREVADEEKSAIVEAWLQHGSSPVVIDSAGKYGAGLSLEVIGRELARLSVSQEDVIISNKLGWRRVPLKGDEPTFEPGAWFGLKHDAVQDISAEGILRCWREGNELLGDYSASLVSVHDPDEYLDAATDPEDRQKRLNDIVDAYRALVDLKSKGQVAAVGVGAKDWKSIQELSKLCDLDWIMFANSFTIMNHPPELDRFMTELKEQGIAIINSAVFHGGFLLGGEFYDYRKVDPDLPKDQELLQWRSKFEAICAEFDISPFEVGVAFGGAHTAVNSLALSSSRAARIESHVKAVSVEVPKALWDKMKSEGLVRSDFAHV